jgi:hypothetical protein
MGYDQPHQWLPGSDYFHGRKVKSHAVSDLAALTIVDASAPERVDLGVLPSLRRGEKYGLKPGGDDARQVPDRLPPNRDRYRERVVPVAWVWDQRRLLAKVDAVRVDVDTPKQAGEPRLMERPPDDLLPEGPILAREIPHGHRRAT